MTTSTNLRDRLADAVGDGLVREAGDADAVVGVVPRWVVRPADEAQVGAVLRVAAEDGLGVVPRGAGTKLDWGAPPERCDIVLDVGGLDELVEHAAGDLVVVAGAGRTLDTLAADLAGAGQRLAVDPARRGTLGGLVATAVSGPVRHLYGPVRDLLIGSRMVRSDGVAARSGGKVVKNVAGYDLGKLLTGSYGTLGVITQVAFRLHPIPEASAWVGAPAQDRERTLAAIHAVVHGQDVPSALELHVPVDGTPVLCALLEGTGPGVEARAARVAAQLGAGAATVDRAPSWWSGEPAGAVLVKLTFEIAALPAVLEAVDAIAGATLRASVGVGVACVGLPADEPDRLADHLLALRAAAASAGGSAVLLRAGGAAGDALGGVDRWGPVPALELMRAIKHRLDPDRVLAPGRFVGGI